MGQESLFGDDQSAPSLPGGPDIFATHSGSPLAARMRPQSLDEVVGQKHLLEPGTPLRRLVEGSGEASVILYGPPGTGKTTLASLIASSLGDNFIGLSALDSGVKQVREVITHARRELIEGRRTVLFIDEVHRFSKTQQDALLAAVENRTVLLVAATTENPSFSVVAPLLSRSLLLHLEPLDDASLRTLAERALTSERGLAGRITATEDALDQLVLLAGGDARRTLTYLEAAAEAVPDGGELTVDILKDNVNRAVVRYDRDGDQHYDVVSAFIKSIRGSDVDAALHYLARMIEAGEDPRFIARRLIVHASEDIGMADPTALPTAVAAAEAAALIGLPEARIPLAQATIHLATAPKSNSVINAINSAQADVRAGKSGYVPPHLRDGHYEGAKRLGNAVGYQYPHDDPRGVLAQQYLPETLADAEYYQPTDHGAEKRVREYLGRLRDIIRGRRR
ncbi:MULTISPECIES: replication-associated recombination protein A [Corynebacterium]|uniref:replication-associated recombination protein A n=1 Tax=Corynebacterium TaxID=1716 RepID=UPI000668247F|nr:MULTISPECIES: replication-associated recombination protein A [Corynebacterium]OFK68479.1 AAA family ATPase [Corynebacterium sp. HMSC076G08]OFN36147.1 AAA family ATPase [Corynebacterium sp. HMSC072A04]OFN77496.1 AAA family ATPase [Corynebacterium sp. HMSC070E08]OFO18856.1 AAA family ATPase [Corynebacterium sp. HMSC056F09]OFQ53593.1 AAA family ATPase [Corynebacterium sp. HMSC074H12]